VPLRFVVAGRQTVCDNPAWVDTTIGGVTRTTRYTTSIGGDLSATVNDDASINLTVADPHGDAAATVTLRAAGAAATGIDAWSDFDEYGNPTTGGPADPLGYGWLGAKQRSTDTAGTGLTLMGSRLYNSATGRFTSLDPVLGGNENAYVYPADPIGSFDLDGNCGWCHRFFHVVDAVLSNPVVQAVTTVAARTTGWGCGVAVYGFAAYNSTRRFYTQGVSVATVVASGLDFAMARYLPRNYGRGISNSAVRRASMHYATRYDFAYASRLSWGLSSRALVRNTAYGAAGIFRTYWGHGW
jgi:RHS repeat-associated protein